MRIDVYIHHESTDSQGTAEALRRIEDFLQILEQKIMATLDQVLQDATDESAVDDSIIALLSSIKAQLDAITQGALPADAQAKVDAIFAQLESNKQKVADAVTANTPAAPSP